MALKEKVRRRVGARKGIAAGRLVSYYAVRGADRSTGRAAAGRFTESMATRSRSESSYDEKGKVVERHSWCGYISIYETLAEVMVAIEEDRNEVITVVDYER